MSVRARFERGSRIIWRKMCGQKYKVRSKKATAAKQVFPVAKSMSWSNKTSFSIEKIPNGNTKRCLLKLRKKKLHTNSVYASITILSQLHVNKYKWNSALNRFLVVTPHFLLLYDFAERHIKKFITMMFPGWSSNPFSRFILQPNCHGEKEKSSYSSLATM